MELLVGSWRLAVGKKTHAMNNISIFAFTFEILIQTMIKIIFIGTLLLFLFGCQETPKTKTIATSDTLVIGGKIYEMETISKKAYLAIHTDVEDTSEKRNIKLDANMVYRNGDTLFLKKTDGAYVQLINNFAEYDDSFAVYSYRYYLDDLGYFVIYAGFWEWYHYLIINQVTGKITYACGPPVVSPDLNYIMSCNEDLLAGFTFNGFELYLVEKDSLRLIESKELRDWGPASMKWIRNDEILVEQSIFDTTEENYIRTNYIQLKRR